jgi:predicted TIM-barrel fold metal-dependent hydrolase
VTTASQRYDVIDVDSHVTEPPDLWTSRLSTKRWGDLVPHVRYDANLGSDRWYVGEWRLPVVGAFSYAGWTKFPPEFPPALDLVDPASYDAKSRVARLDEYGIGKQLIYPNILGFYSHVFATLDPELSGAIVSAYNDFQSSFAEEGDGRFVPLTILPYWDRDAAVVELERCAAMGHKGVVLGLDYPRVGVPPLRDEYWDPVLSAAQRLGLPVNFHIGFASASKEEMSKHQKIEDRRQYCKETALFMLGNANAIAEVIVSGLCHDYPELNFVSVESGAGFVPFLLRSLDWQWTNSGARDEYPDWLMPSEYFRRQIYGTFWFEGVDGTAITPVLEELPDNMMFETDFPHPTSLSPGPNSYAPNPRDLIDDELSKLPEDTLGKVLHGNAARIYGLS